MTTLNWRKSLPDRFWKKVLIIPNGCWLWLGATDADGYGLIYNTDAPPSHFRATHICCQLTGRDIPAGKLVCHTCDNPTCVRPDHLWIGSHQENARDRDLKGRHAHCGPITPASGIRHPMALYGDRIGDVHSLRTIGLTYREIAMRVSMSASNVGRILRGETWQ
jgi:hypothetical protein